MQVDIQIVTAIIAILGIGVSGIIQSIKKDIKTRWSQSDAGDDCGVLRRDGGLSGPSPSVFSSCADYLRVNRFRGGKRTKSGSQKTGLIDLV